MHLRRFHMFGMRRCHVFTITKQCACRKFSPKWIAVASFLTIVCVSVLYRTFALLANDENSVGPKPYTLKPKAIERIVDAKDGVDVDTVHKPPRKVVDVPGSLEHFRDLLKEEVPKFDPQFKNPCWSGGPSGKGLHCLPYFYVIGVKKSGTTTIFGLISRHPDFKDAGFKEAQWFPRQRFDKGKDGIINYIRLFDIAAKTIFTRPNQTITGEGSPSNLHLNSRWRYLQGNEGLKEPKHVILDYIHHFLPEAKIIIIFRDPVERLFSDYYHEWGRLLSYPNTGPDHFHVITTTGLSLYKDCFERFTVRSCVYNETIYDFTKMQIQLGIYYIYWEELTRLYPKDQIKVIHYEHFRKNIQTTAQNIFDFLQMRPPGEAEWRWILADKKDNARLPQYFKQGEMLEMTRKSLQDFYRPFNQQMFKLTNDEHFLYTY